MGAPFEVLLIFMSAVLRGRDLQVAVLVVVVVEGLRSSRVRVFALSSPALVSSSETETKLGLHCQPSARRSSEL